MKKNALLKKLVQVKVADNPRDIAEDLVTIALSDQDDGEKAEDIGERIDDAIVFDGPVGGLLEGLDDVAAEKLAEVALAAVQQARAHVLERVAEKVEELEEELRDAGVAEHLIETFRERLGLSELAA